MPSGLRALLHFAFFDCSMPSSLETLISVSLVKSVLRNLNFPNHFLEFSAAKEANKNPLCACVPRTLSFPSWPPYNIISSRLYASESDIWPSWISASEVCLLFTNALTFFFWRWFCSVICLGYFLWYIQVFSPQILWFYNFLTRVLLLLLSK